jgi:hypothetical protein
MASRADSSSIQLQGIPFPYGVREQGASVEVVRFEGVKETELNSWVQRNLFQNGEERWGIISKSKTKEESEFLTMGFRRVQRSRLRLHSGRVERTEEEITEPELGEFHFRHKDALLELYSVSAKQRTTLFQSLREDVGKDSLNELMLTKDAMKSLMTEAIDISSVSLSALGNPFFSDATLTGTDPTNSKTYRELGASGEIRSFRARFASTSDEAGSSPLVLTISSKCKIRFFAGQSPVLQSDIEEFVQKVANIAQLKREDQESDRKILAS